MKRSVLMLNSDRVSAVYAPETIPLFYEISALNLPAQNFKILYLPLPENPFYTVFSKSAPKAKYFLEKYNKARKKINLSYEEYLSLYLKNINIIRF